ncbi:MAG: hypothetical protein LJE62_12055 [Silicimonas sp.]|jgi:hypothetical protein|nr:hypothetical protein [Silicimonas sp.]
MKLALTIAATVLPGLALAGVCGPDRDTDIDVFEQAKAAFFDTDYREFSRILGDFFPDLDARYDSLFGGLERAIPEGYDRCETVLQRREAPGFHQEMIFYFPKGSPAPMALLLIAAEVDGKTRMVEFNYNTSLSEVFSELK